MITIIKDKVPSLAEAQKAVGGFVQVLFLKDGRQMLVNEEGKLNGLPLNSEATKLARGLISANDYIVGNVLILEGKARWD